MWWYTGEIAAVNQIKIRYSPHWRWTLQFEGETINELKLKIQNKKVIVLVCYIPYSVKHSRMSL